MMRFKLIFLAFFFFSWTNAQTVYSELARQHAEQGNIEKAIELEKEGLEILMSIKGDRNLEYVTSLNSLASFNASLGNYSEAIRLVTQALKILKEIQGERHSNYAISLGFLGNYNAELGNYSEAIRLVTQAMKIFKEILGERTFAYASTLNSLASFNARLGNYSEAIRLVTQALEIFKEVLGERHRDYITSLYDLAVYNANLGNYSLALRVGTEVMEIFKEIQGERHSNYAISLGVLGNYNAELGNYEEAIRLVTQAMKIQKEVLGESHPEYAKSLGVLGYMYLYFGNYSEAIRLVTQAMKIFKEVLGERNSDYATSLNYLALCNFHQSNYTEAIRLVTLAMEIQKEVLGERHPDYAKLLCVLGNINAELGNYTEAIRFGTQGMEIIREVLGERHPDYAMSLSLLASYKGKLGNDTEAIRLVTQAMEIQKEVLGERHRYFTNALQDLIEFDYTNIFEYSSLVTSNIINEVKDNFKYLPRDLRKTFWDKNNSWFEKSLPNYSFITEENSILEQSFNGALLSKGILLNSEIEFDKFLSETGAPELAEKYNEIKALRLQLNKLYEKPMAERWCDTDSLERVANNLERELMYESKEFGDYTRNLSITWQDVQKGLKKKDVAIEFVSFPLNQDSTMYMAYVLKPDMESPEMVKLFEEKDITSLYPPTKPENIYHKDEATDLIWRKLQPYLEGCENVYFAPDGVLHQIAIEYLPDFEGEGTMADRFRMHRLSSTRQIALNQDKNASTSAAVYGGIVYDNDVASMETESRKYPKEEDLLAHRGFNPFLNYTDILDTRDGVKYLEGTKAEAEKVNQSLKDNKYQTQLTVGREATEESFKNLSGKNNGIIHIATHGFYWMEEEADRMARSNERLMFMTELNDNGPRYVEDKALTRSGLFMAGANNILSGDSIPEGVDNGILTAQEIAQMNLRGTDLVVLSACQTGMGEISGDGVFGLQRGFKKAGVNSLMMSLWDVDDDATQMLMTSFYENLMSGQTKQQSLLNAQKTVREFSGEINGVYRDFSNPRYWAAFILLDALN